MTACFEHFAMPWILATEISKLLKVGGLVLIENNFAFSSHERPWNIFNLVIWRCVFCFPAKGFECIESGFSNPIVGRFSSLASPYPANQPIASLYRHVEFLGKKVEEVQKFDWTKFQLDEVVGSTTYPKPKPE